MEIIKRRALILLAVSVSGSCYFFSIGLSGCGALIWFAPFPILILSIDLLPRQTLIVSFCTSMIGSFTLYQYLAHTLLMPPGGVIILLAIPAAGFALAVAAARYVALEISPSAAIFVFPSVMTLYGYLTSILSPNGTAGNIAYTQVDFLPLMQIVSITGLFGITFLLGLVPSGFAMAWHLRKNRKAAILATGVPLALLLSFIAYGSYRLSIPVEGQTVRVGLAATDLTIRHSRATTKEEGLSVVKEYAGRVEKLAAQGVKIIVLPEKFVGVTDSYADETYKTLATAARRGEVILVAGLNLISTDVSRNVAVIFSPDGRVLGEYGKIHLVPGFETRYQSGTEPFMFLFSGIKFGVAICKDMDFPGLLSRYGRDGAGILLVPAWDFGVDAKWHARMAITRGIESGFSVVRTAQDGLLTVSDHMGRIIAQEKSSAGPEVILSAIIHTGTGGTFYSIYGDWVVRLNLLFITWIIILSFYKNLRIKK